MAGAWRYRAGVSQPVVESLMARGALLSRHRRVIDASLTKFLENQRNRIRVSIDRDSERFKDVLDAIDTSRGPVVRYDEIDVETRR